MSYLAPLRLHFAGQFQAAVSTVNNDPTHYDNATFKKEYQLPGNTRGWWNPRGNADWRLIGCAVTAAHHGDGKLAAASDPVLELIVADSDRRVAAKLVDLDPEQQLVSTIFGLEVRLADAVGTTLVRGRFQPAPFVDIWNRAQGPGSAGDIGACAAYQSVLTDLEWGDVTASPWLTELRGAAGDGLLSLRFNVDGYNMNMRSPDFTRGRIVGTIGAASADEPEQFVLGRQFMAVPANAPGFFTPVGAINFCTATIADGQVLVDLGNALPTTSPGGPQEDLGTLTLGYVPDAGAPVALGTIDYTGDGWYEQTAGVASVAITADQAAAAAQAPLQLTLADVQTPTGEVPDYVRADAFVFRLDPGDSCDVRLFATRFGERRAGAQVSAVADASGLQGDGGSLQVATPASAISFADSVTTGPDGTATLTISASDPGNPRGYIDGQVYGVRPALADAPAGAPADPWAFVSVLVYDAFEPDGQITWWGDLEPVFQQYANLYPVMDLFLDMGDYESVCDNQELLRLAFGLDPDNPNSMPVTRDLSRSKREAILRWLDSPGADGKPLLGMPPPPVAPAAARDMAVSPGPPPGAPEGGKAAAAARRLVIPGADSAEGGRR